MRSATTDRRQLLRPYLPRLALQWLHAAPDEIYQEVEGSVAFVDISGFTRLSERLAKKGRVGAEELSAAIGTCFTRLLGVAYGNGGGLIKFGGDALLLLFRGAEHEAKAARAAVGMRRALREIGALDCQGTRVTLRMSVGVHSGVFHFFLVGGSHRELMVAGPAASETVRMESTATAGEILVSAATAGALPRSVLGPERDGGYLLKREPPGLALEEVDFSQGEDPEDIVSYIPAAVRSRLLAGLTEPEHKRVTVAFLHFDSTDVLIDRAGPAAAAAYLDQLVRDTQEAVDEHELCFLGTDIDRDGGKIILTAGAPATTGNDEERMLLALRQIVEVPRMPQIRVGVNRGYVFAGDIGPSYRRTYTVMGDAVNLAARVMAKARSGQILATADVLEPSRTQFKTTALEPFMVKGKAHPVHAFEVGAVAGARVDTDEELALPLIGRDREMKVLIDAFDAARTGRGSLVEIAGDVGLGKSRLVDELRAHTRDTAHFTLQCELYESSTPYFPFRTFLRTILGIEGESNEAAAERLSTILRETAPHLVPWAPLLAIPLEIDVPATTEFLELDESFRSARLAVVVRELLALLLPSVTLIAVEDAHWMDEASAELLRRLVPELAGLPWLVVVTRRDAEGGFTIEGRDDGAMVRIEPLDDDAAEALVEAMTEDEPLAPHQVLDLTKRAAGNPMFLRELLAAARVAGGTEHLPDSVDALIGAKIDRLEPGARTLLRHLAVLGPSFDRRLAAAVIPEAFEDPAWGALQEFLTAERGGVVRFRHSLIRDAAYEGLPFRVRETLHAEVGETIERTAGPADDQSEVLSLHYFHARRFDAAWRHSRIAADRARTLYANVEAALFYERAIEAGRHSAAAAPELAAAWEALGDVRKRLGEYARAAEAYTAARRLVTDDVLGTARLLLKQGGIEQIAGRYPGALRWFARTDRVLRTASGVEATARRGQLAVAYASVKKDQGRWREVVRWCLRAIDEAQRAADKDSLARAYSLLDMGYVAQGQWDKATYSNLALSLYEDIGNLWGQGVVLNNLGSQAYFAGRWDEALRLYEQARVAWDRSGDAASASIASANMAEILSDQGKLEEADRAFRRALRTSRAAGDRKNVAFILGHLGRIAYRDSRFDEAMALLQEARDESEHAGSVAAIVDIDARMAECHGLRGATDEALAALARANERAKAIGVAGAFAAPVLMRVEAAALLQTDELYRGRELLEEGIALARARKDDFELSLMLRLKSRAMDVAGEPSLQAAAESRRLLAQLGVVQIADPPIGAASAAPSV